MSFRPQAFFKPINKTIKFKQSVSQTVSLFEFYCLVYWFEKGLWPKAHRFIQFFFIKNKNYVCMCVCQFPLAAYYGKVARARMVKFSHKIRPVQPFVVLNFRGCAINGVHVRGASLPHFGSGRRRRRVTRAELRFLAVKTERFIPDN